MNQIVITGSTRGIGRALAGKFLEKGWSVVINGRNQTTVDSTVSELIEASPGCRCRGLAGDVSSADNMGRLWDLAIAEGPVDIWINNAGIDQSRSLLWDIDPEEIRSILNVNILGTLMGTRAAVRGMAVQGSGVIYLMEGFGSNGMVRPGVSMYGASKAAVTYLVKALKSEIKSEKIPVKIGAISPGMVLTDLLLSGLPEEPSEALEAKRVFNILADTPETVSTYICNRIVDSRPRRVTWLTGAKIFWRFATAFLIKRNLFPDE